MNTTPSSAPTSAPLFERIALSVALVGVTDWLIDLCAAPYAAPSRRWSAVRR